ncbi:MAG: hypothetical protein V3S55_13410 [Nitrospiraceae bacterium]
MAKEFKFSASSKARLDACHPDLRIVFYTVVKGFDCKVHEGPRGQIKQNRYFEAGKSKVRWPNSKHNTRPSEAVHVIPYPFPGWKNTVAFYFFAGYVIATAEQMGIEIRWGGDWNRNKRMGDQTFMDLQHFEVVKKARRR